MTDAASKPNLGRFGSFGRGVTPQQAKEIESLGYGAVWVGGSPPAELAWVEPILEATTTLQVATGIVNIWTAAAKPVAESFHRIDKAYPGRFLLGIGVGHREAISEYRKPYDALVEYLDQLDEYGVPANRRVVAALGPRVLKLSAERSAGAHPYLTTPEHTAQARELIGASAFLAPEHKVVLTTRRRQGPCGGPQGARHLLQPGQLPQQLEAAGLFRRGSHPAGQRPPGRLGGRLRHAGRDRGTAKTSTSTRAPTTCPCRSSPRMKTWSRRWPNWRGRSD